MKTTAKLRYILAIEATDDPSFFGFYAPDLEGFTGVGNSIEKCLYKARWDMEEHVALLLEQHLPVPPPAVDPKVIIQNSKPCWRRFQNRSKRELKKSNPRWVDRVTTAGRLKVK